MKNPRKDFEEVTVFNEHLHGHVFPARSYENNKLCLPKDMDAEDKMPSLPEEIESLDQLDYYLDCINVPMLKESQECYLRLHKSIYYLMKEQRDKVTGQLGPIIRYRGYLLIFDTDIPKGLMQVGRIFDEIENLLNLQASFSPMFGLKEKHTLNYLDHNRYKF